MTTSAIQSPTVPGRPAPAGRKGPDRLRAPAVVPGPAGGATGVAVVAAIDDDGNPGRILAYAREQARRRQVALRVVHVWTGTHRRPGRDEMSEADRFLATALYDHLPPPEAEAAERQILHDPDPTAALAALSREVGLLVVAANSAATDAGELGATASGLAGHTACPLAIVPAAGPAGPRAGWWRSAPAGTRCA